jgi:hypothetical protein
MLLAQSMGEYGGMSSLMATLASSFQSGSQWLQLSLREDTSAWVAAGVGVCILMWLFRGR